MTWTCCQVAGKETYVLFSGPQVFCGSTVSLTACTGCWRVLLDGEINHLHTITIALPSLLRPRISINKLVILTRDRTATVSGSVLDGCVRHTHEARTWSGEMPKKPTHTRYFPVPPPPSDNAGNNIASASFVNLVAVFCQKHQFNETLKCYKVQQKFQQQFTFKYL